MGSCFPAAARFCLVVVAVVYPQLCSASGGFGSPRAEIEAFAAKLELWRAVSTPITDDDLPRTAVVRPDGWAPNVSWSALTAHEVELELLSRELGALRGIPRGAPTIKAPTKAPTKAPATGQATGAEAFASWDRADQVDWWACSALLARRYWDLRVMASAKRDPTFYVLQSAGAVWDELVRQPEPDSTASPPAPVSPSPRLPVSPAHAPAAAAAAGTASPWSASRMELRLLPRLAAIPAVMAAGRVNLERSGMAVAVRCPGLPFDTLSTTLCPFHCPTLALHAALTVIRMGGAWASTMVVTCVRG